MGSNEGMLGGGWLFVIVIILLLGGGFGGFGNSGANVEAAINQAIANQSTATGLRDVLLSSANNNYETSMLISQQNLLNEQQRSADQINILQGFNAINQTLANLGSTMQECCCSIKTTLLQDKYDEALRELNKAQAEAIAQAQSQYLLGVMGKWVANAPAA